jgi:hypothetical protein
VDLGKKTRAGRRVEMMQEIGDERCVEPGGESTWNASPANVRCRSWTCAPRACSVATASTFGQSTARFPLADYAERS